MSDVKRAAKLAVDAREPQRRTLGCILTVDWCLGNPLRKNEPLLPKQVDCLNVWTISNQKGGVGKTTSAVTLAGIAAEAGARVLLIDLDPHGSLTSYFQHDPDRTEVSAFTLFSERKSMSHSLVSNLLIATPFSGISLLPASTALATLERQGIGDGMGLVLGKAVACLQYDFDRVIIDCPPQLGVLMVNALAACEELVVPVQTEFLAIKGLERMLHTLKMFSRSRKRELSFCIVPTMFDRRTQASVSSLRAIRNNYGDNVWPGIIPVDTKFRDASRAGIPPNIFQSDSRGVAAYRSLFHYLCRESAAIIQHGS